MIVELISKVIDPEKIKAVIQNMNMTREVEKLIDALHGQKKTIDENLRRAAILNIVNLHTNTLTLHCTDFGNISIKVPLASISSALYSVPGCSILFAINSQSFTIQLYSLSEGQLTIKDRVTISENNPVVIDGRYTLFDYNSSSKEHQAFIGSINLPDAKCRHQCV